MRDMSTGLHVPPWSGATHITLPPAASPSWALTQYSMVTAFVFRYSLRASCPVGVTVSVDNNHNKLEYFVPILQQDVTQMCWVSNNRHLHPCVSWLTAELHNISVWWALLNNPHQQ